MNQISFDDLLTDEYHENVHISSPLYEHIIKLLESEITSTLEICESLIDAGLISKERYSSNKPKDYPIVCLILDELVQQGKAKFVEDKDKTDRIYSLAGSKL